MQAKLYNNRGVAQYRLGRYAEALSDFDRAIEIDPKYAEAYANRGNTKCALKQYDAAIQNYDEALRIDPGNQTAIDNKTYVIELQGSKEYSTQFKGTEKEYKERQDDYKKLRKCTRRKICFIHVLTTVLIASSIAGLFFYSYLACGYLECTIDLEPSSIVITLTVPLLLSLPLMLRIPVLVKDEKRFHALEEDAFSKRQIIQLIGASLAKGYNKNDSIIWRFIEHHEKRSSADIAMGFKPPPISPQEVPDVTEDGVKETLISTERPVQHLTVNNIISNDWRQAIRSERQLAIGNWSRSKSNDELIEKTSNNSRLKTSNRKPLEFSGENLAKLLESDWGVTR